MTPKQIQASRTNGARSRGPVTEQGKQNSARNSFRHGLLAETVVLEEEATDRFLDLLVEYMDEFQPSTASQVSLVETMAVARWRQLRVWGAQKTAIDRDMALQDPSVGPAPVRVLAALRGTPESLCPPEVLLRYEIAFDRQFSRALSRLLALQSHPAAQPPKPYHPETPAGQAWKEEMQQEMQEEMQEENTSTAERTPEVIENTPMATQESGLAPSSGAGRPDPVHLGSRENRPEPSPCPRPALPPASSKGQPLQRLLRGCLSENTTENTR